MTSSTSSSGSTTQQIKLSGLASGLDTASIIKQLLAPEQAKIDKLNKNVELNTAKIQSYNDIGDQLKSFGDAITVLRADGTSGKTLFDNKTATSSDTAIATAQASSAAVTGSYAVDVTNIATSRIIFGSLKATSYTLPAGGNIKLNGQTIALTTGMTLAQIATAINNTTYQAGEEVTASVVANRLTVSTTNTGSGSMLYGTTKGSEWTVGAPGGTDDPSNILRTELGLIDATGAVVNEAQAADDANLTINGIPIVSETNDLVDTVGGLSINLIEAGTTTLTVKANTTGVKAAIQNFVDQYNQTRDLIDRVRNVKLNETDKFGPFFNDPLLSSLFASARTLTTGQVSMGGAAWAGTLTLNAAASLDATQVAITGFTSTGKTLLAGDQFTINGDPQIYTLTADKSGTTNPQAGISIKPPLVKAYAGGVSVRLAVQTLENVGVGVLESNNSGLAGTVGVLDEGLLDSMLANNLDQVKAIFRRSDVDPLVSGYTASSSSQGVARRLYDWVDRQVKISSFTSITRSIPDTKVKGLEDANTQLADQVKRLTEQMNMKEASLTKKYADMEAAMAKSQSATASLKNFGS